MDNITEHLTTQKTRQELESITGQCDRINRHKIRSSGKTICNLQDGKGYILADKNTPEGQEAIRVQHKLFWSRIFALIDDDKPFRESIFDLNQLSIFNNLQESIKNLY